jgi:hypothetical protein
MLSKYAKKNVQLRASSLEMDKVTIPQINTNLYCVQRIIVFKILYDVIIARLDVMTLSCCFFVSLSSLCFATDEDGSSVRQSLGGI